MPTRGLVPLLAVLLAGAVLLSPGAAPASLAAPPVQLTAAPLPTLDVRATLEPPAVRSVIDTALTDHLAKLLDYQAAYQGGRGRFYQQLASHTIPPADGQLVAPDRLNEGPTDQAEKLDAFWTDAKLAPELPYSFRVDVYDGPEGQGYVVVVQTVLKGELWERSVNTGPETYREAGWHVVSVEGER